MAEKGDEGCGRDTGDAARGAKRRWARGLELSADLGGKASLIVALAVLSHWMLDFLVHRPDLPLYDNTAKVGLGLWNVPVIAFGLEAALLFGGMWLHFGTSSAPRRRMVLFGLVMLAIQAYIFFGPPPVSDKAAAWTALLAYAVFAGVVARLATPARAFRQGAA